MTDLTELEAYLDQRAGPPGHVRPCHDLSCPAREAWVQLSQCTCPRKLTEVRRG